MSDLLLDLVAVEPVIALHGPRSVGKPTVLDGFTARTGGSVLDLRRWSVSTSFMLAALRVLHVDASGAPAWGDRDRGPATIWVMVRSRGYLSYAAGPWPHRRGKRHSLLRTAQLNAVGWSALLGACLVAATVGVGAAAAIAVPHWWGAVLGVLPLGAVVLLDRRRWAAMETSFGWGGSAVDVAHVVSELTELGVSTRVRTAPNAEGWGEPVDGWGEPEQSRTGDRVLKTASLSYRNRDRAAVAQTLRAHGIHFPDRA